MKRSGVTLTRTEYGAVILDMRKGKYYQLNEVAADIAELAIAGSASVEEIAQMLTDRYSVSAETVQADVLQHLDQLQSLGLISK